jgi:hypothetical protein
MVLCTSTRERIGRVILWIDQIGNILVRFKSDLPCVLANESNLSSNPNSCNESAQGDG